MENIEVSVRVRPLNALEVHRNEPGVWTIHQQSGKSISLKAHF